MILVNGSEQHCLDIADRGFQYGDGLFETIAIENAHPVFLREHLHRLKTGCSILKIPYPGDALIISELKLLLDSESSAVLKIILSRGKGGRGYRQPETIEPTRILSLHPYPDYPESYKTNGIRARLCDFRMGANPALAGVKHLNRLEQVLARSEWRDEDIQEGLMLDINDYLVEGTMSNVFIAKDKQLLTPILDNNGVKGIIRQIILDYADQYDLNMRCTKIQPQTIFEADEIFVSNSVIGLWPVASLGQYRYQIGPVSHQAQALLTKRKQKDREYVF